MAALACHLRTVVRAGHGRAAEGIARLLVNGSGRVPLLASLRSLEIDFQVTDERSLELLLGVIEACNDTSIQ